MPHMPQQAAGIQRFEVSGDPMVLNPPEADEVHLWRVAVDMPAEIARLRLTLSPDELRRADTYRQVADRDRFAITRAALRNLLGRYADIPADMIEFTYTSHGKPRCPRLLPIDFNVAHSGSLALVAISSAQAVGVDIERIRTGLNLAEIGKQVFTPSELHDLSQRPLAQQANAFFDLWVRKEAYLKCTGEGLTTSPQTIHVGLADCAISNSGLNSSDLRRLVRSFTPAAEYAAAVAAEKRLNRVTVGDWEITAACVS